MGINYVKQVLTHLLSQDQGSDETQIGGSNSESGYEMDRALFRS